MTGSGISHANVSLSISQSLAIRVIRDNFNGLTTDFTQGGNAALENLILMTLERATYGKIVFNEKINLTTDAYSPTSTLYDRVVDIDSNLQISTNYLSVNSLKLSSLNKSATISFYHISYVSPKILRNGNECPTSICTLVSYSGGIAIFDVNYLEHTTITTYSLAEGYEDDQGEDEGGAGGGGGGNVTPEELPPVVVGGASFTITPNLISVDIEKGNYYPNQVVLYNDGSEDLIIDVSSSSEISKLLDIPRKTIGLKVGQSEVFQFSIYALTRFRAGIYTGTISFISEKVSKNLDLVVKIQELPALFDLNIKAVRKYVLPGRVVLGDIQFKNIGDSVSVDVILEYGIMDFNNIVYLSRQENVTVLGETTIKRVSLKLPENLDMGRYVLYSKIYYQDKVAVSSDTFQIERISLIMWVISIILILVLVALVIFAIILLKKREKEEEIEEIRKDTNTFK
jgi:hypothetical protein